MENLSAAEKAERRRCVAADAGRKRPSWKWIGRGFPVPEKLLPCRPQAPAPPVAPQWLAEGSSSGSWSFSTAESLPRTPVQPREVATDEDGYEIYDPSAFSGTVTREDFVPDEVLATVTSAVAARSAEEVHDAAKCRRRELVINELMLEQGLEQDRLHREQGASTARDKGKSVVIYLDSDSDDE